MDKLVTGKTTTSQALYRELYRVFYKENWKVLRIVLTILSIPCFIAGLYTYEFEHGTIYTVIPIAMGLVFIIYPRNAYRRPAKQMKGITQTMTFEFYEDELREKSSGESQTFKYKDIHMIVETPKYFFIFNTRRTASALEKSGIKTGDVQTLKNLLKNKCKKYIYRKN